MSASERKTPQEPKQAKVNVHNYNNFAAMQRRVLSLTIESSPVYPKYTPALVVDYLIIPSLNSPLVRILDASSRS